jgi:hypothetical protein
MADASPSAEGGVPVSMIKIRVKTMDPATYELEVDKNVSVCMDVRETAPWMRACGVCMVAGEGTVGGPVDAPPCARIIHAAPCAPPCMHLRTCPTSTHAKHPQATVLSVKTDHLLQHVDAPADRQRLIFKGRALLDSHTLAQSGARVVLADAWPHGVRRWPSARTMRCHRHMRLPTPPLHARTQVGLAGPVYL